MPLKADLKGQFDHQGFDQEMIMNCAIKRGYSKCLKQIKTSQLTTACHVGAMLLIVVFFLLQQTVRWCHPGEIFLNLNSSNRPSSVVWRLVWCLLLSVPKLICPFGFHDGLLGGIAAILDFGFTFLFG